MVRAGVLCLTLAFGALGQSHPAGRSPETIDYADPVRYTKIPPRDGDAAAIVKISESASGNDVEHVIRNIDAFIADRIPHVEEPWLPDHRDFQALVAGFDHDNCACFALLFANLLRARGIPAVYVKSARHDWIRSFVATARRGSFAGHVFLEVFLDGRWKLLDPQGMRLWDQYDPKDPELPGGFLAYEKGSDHQAMVHSTRRDDFIREAIARWRGFDVSRLRTNDAPGRSLVPKAFALTMADEWQVLRKHVPNLSVYGADHWEKAKAESRGSVLFVTSVAGRTGLPLPDVDAWLPASIAQLQEDARAGRSNVRARTLPDGTLVVLVSAPDADALTQLMRSAELERIRCGFVPVRSVDTPARPSTRPDSQPARRPL